MDQLKRVVWQLWPWVAIGVAGGILEKYLGVQSLWIIIYGLFCAFVVERSQFRTSGKGDE